jgi:uncharacterized protein YutE (UPF0331/DUF86 family)
LINTAVLSKRLNKLREYIALLHKIRKEEKGCFISDTFVYGNAERYLHLAIQCVLDIGNHFISEKKFDDPNEYRDIIIILGEADIIPFELA